MRWAARGAPPQRSGARGRAGNGRGEDGAHPAFPPPSPALLSKAPPLTGARGAARRAAPQPEANTACAIFSNSAWPWEQARFFLPWGALLHAPFPPARCKPLISVQGRGANKPRCAQVQPLCSAPSWAVRKAACRLQAERAGEGGPKLRVAGSCTATRGVSGLGAAAGSGGDTKGGCTAHSDANKALTVRFPHNCRYG